MGVQFKNNAFSTLDTAISAVDVGLAVAYGDGTLFPAAGAGDYFYMTITALDDTYEVVKVTARSGDSMTITRAQEGTTALAFSAGSLCDLRVTAQGLIDKFLEDNITANSVALSDLATISAARVLGSTAGGNVSELSASGVLDLLGTTRGSLVYRGASGWTPLTPGTSGQLLQSGGTGADPSWTTAIGLSDGDKGDITVASSGTAWTIDNAAVTLAKMANINQYEIIARSSASAGVPQVLASSANMFSLLGAANYAAARTLLGLDTMATQGSGAVAITGGTATGLSSLQGTMKVATNTTGTLALVDADCFIPMTGTVTLDGAIFSARQAFVFYAGASSRTITQGSSMTLHLGGTATTGSRTLAAYTLAVGVVIDTNTIVISGSGVT